MLPPDYFTGKEERILSIYQKWEDFVMRDIARRLLASGGITSTADRLIWKMQQAGLHRETIIKKLSSLTGMTTKELKMLLRDAVLTSWEDEANVMSQIGMELSYPLENPMVIEVMDAEYKKSLAELENLTRTTMDKTQRDLINLMDDAEIRVSSGTQSYNAAVCQVLDEYAGKGIKVQYPSGTELTLEAAVRMCVVTSMNQTAAQITNQYIAETGCNYVLFSAHSGARVAKEGQPVYAGHDNWQGRAFSIAGSEPGYPNLLESTGYDIDPITGKGTVVDPLGAHGYNCRHSHRIWDKRLENPWRDENGNLILGDGNILTNAENERRYKIQQKQRGMERGIRKTKRQLMIKQQQIDKIAETDVKSILQGDYDKMSAKLLQQNKAYNDFCKENDLQPDYIRNKVADFGRKQQAQANAGAKRYINEIKS